MPMLGAKRERRLLLPVSVSISPASPTLGATGGNTVQLSAASKDLFGNAATSTYTWTSSNSAAMTVDSTGLVTRVAAGSSTIKAVSAEGWSAQVVIS